MSESASPAPAPLSIVHELAQRLGETDPEAVRMLERMIDSLGEGFARLVLDETLGKEAAGGLLTVDKTRRRTPGGVFFELANRRVARWRKNVIAHQIRRGIRPTGGGPPARGTGPPAETAFDWSNRRDLYAEAGKQKGQASSVKTTVIGRPSSVVKRGTFVVAVLESRKMPPLPKGMPTPPASPTTFTVFMSAKHWGKVEASVQSPEDVLIVEGVPTLDAEAKTICVFATNTTTKLLQQAAKAPKAATDGEG